MENTTKMEVLKLTWPSSRDSSIKAIMIKTAAKPPDTKEMNLAIRVTQGAGNCFR